MPFSGFWQLGLSKGVIYWEKFSTLHEHSHFYGNWNCFVLFCIYTVI